jgi:hypothetical protein
MNDTADKMQGYFSSVGINIGKIKKIINKSEKPLKNQEPFAF